ncbi:MAG: hypothetical protein NMNS01_20550 [Nitrosomonas sp.]|nr:MAG: hypothetical protein NMNS01_20550 [Nitrosomonas sp.]
MSIGDAKYSTDITAIIAKINNEVAIVVWYDKLTFLIWLVIVGLSDS